MDFLAASFVSTRQDIQDIRTFLDQNGGKKINLIAKIENRAGVDNIDSIHPRLIEDGFFLLNDKNKYR